MPASSASAETDDGTAQSDEGDKEADASATDDLLGAFFGEDDAAPLSAGRLSGRPGFSESAATLPPGMMLLNLGMHLESDIDTGLLLSATAFDVPEALLRVGVFDYLEVRVGGSFRLAALAQDEDFDEPPPIRSGVGHFTLGGTVRILEERRYWPAVAALLAADVPLQNLRLGDFSARGTLALQKSLLDRFFFRGNFGADWNGATERLTLPYRAQAAVAIGLGVGAYAELFGDIFVGGFGFDTLPSAWADGGLYYDLTERLRLDALLGVNAFGARGDWLAQIGLTWLISS